MKRYFMAGLAILLPAAVTLIITVFIVNLLTKPFRGLITTLINKYQLSILGSPEVVLILSKVAVLFVLFGFILLLGFIARVYFVNIIFRISDFIIHKIPFVNKIYKALQDVMSTLFSQDSNNYSQVVFVPYPKEGSWSIGFVTQNDVPKGSDQEHMGMISVFVAGTPNPTMGFMLLFKREQLIFTDMTVDEAMRFIVSCGVMCAPFFKEASVDEI